MVDPPRSRRRSLSLLDLIKPPKHEPSGAHSPKGRWSVTGPVAPPTGIQQVQEEEEEVEVVEQHLDEYAPDIIPEPLRVRNRRRRLGLAAPPESCERGSGQDRGAARARMGRQSVTWFPDLPQRERGPAHIGVQQGGRAKSPAPSRRDSRLASLGRKLSGLAAGWREDKRKTSCVPVVAPRVRVEVDQTALADEIWSALGEELRAEDLLGLWGVGEGRCSSVYSTDEIPEERPEPEPEPEPMLRRCGCPCPVHTA